jgi:hypothetical protein
MALLGHPVRLAECPLFEMRTFASTPQTTAICGFFAFLIDFAIV